MLWDITRIALNVLVLAFCSCGVIVMGAAALAVIKVVLDGKEV